MDGILLHVLYQGAEAMAFAKEMQQGLRSDVLAEDGCLQYDYFLPIGKENCVLLIEHWRDQAALDRHSAGEPMARLKALKASHGLTAEVTRYE